MHAGATASSQIGEALGTTLLNNAALSESTLIHAKLSLMSLAESRQLDERKRGITITEEQFESFLRIAEALQQVLPLLRVVGKDDRSSLKAKIFSARKLLEPSANVAESAKICIAQKPRERDEMSKMIIGSRSTRCQLRLDDAVSVIRSLSQTRSQAEQTASSSEVESIESQKIKRYCLQ